MTENVSEHETVYKKLEDLDSEINAFIRTVKEIKEIRETAGGLTEKLQDHEAEIENQQKRLDNLLSSTHDVLITFEEKSQEVIFDLEKKTGDVAEEVKSRIDEFEKNFSRSSEKWMEKNIRALQRRPYETENRMIKMEERLMAIIDENHKRQKTFSLILLTILIAGTVLSLAIFYMV